MTTKLSPIVSEFETQEQADSYDRWFRTKVQSALDDPRPGIPHDEAMVMLERLLEEKRASRAKRAIG
ncbi:type II toxin-antitoxin system RelB family antitoxin [Serratia fonticola]|uniref:Stability determinant n=1 Tax=Serratia fonticola TaxID=47917 RepID=A0AAW3WK17_SERFO|nr:stability determinant [Serratia fonticola]MBC3211056.1 stability determinant [Serratia fonticola]NYA12038.1 stability determinant [Serratia fonticola]NYA31617.1 stability determinant [Serratia fonticola]